jgi:hypothetical protein
MGLGLDFRRLTDTRYSSDSIDNASEEKPLEALHAKKWVRALGRALGLSNFTTQAHTLEILSERISI